MLTGELFQSISADRVKLLSVTDITDPSTELNADAGSAPGDIRVAYETVAGVNKITIYSWDNASNVAENVPFTIDGATGQWIAIAGAYSYFNSPLPMKASTDPASSVAVDTTAVDAYSGVIITLTGAGNAQTIGDPTDTTAGKTYWIVADSENGANTIDIVFGGTSAFTITLSAGESTKAIWNGTYWLHGTGVDADDIDFSPSTYYGSSTNVQDAIDTFAPTAVKVAEANRALVADANLDVSNLRDFSITRSMAIGTTPDADMGLILAQARTVTATENGIGIYVNPTFTEDSGATVHTTMAGIYINGFTVTDGTATTTNIASLYIAGAPTGATATNGNKAIQVASGDVAFADNLLFDTASEIQWNATDKLIHTANTMTVAGFTTWDMGAVATLDFDGAIDIHTSAAKSASIGTDAMLDLYGGAITILAGADNDAKTRTNSTDKQMLFGMPEFLTGDTPAIASIIYAKTETGVNEVNIGGGDASMNAATSVNIYADDDASTPTGVQVATFQGGAAKALMMGLGNSALSDWDTIWSVFQLGGIASMWSPKAVTTGNSLILSNNVYTSGGDKRILDDEVTLYKQKNGEHIWQVATNGAIDSAISWTTALTIANDASATFGGQVNVSRINAIGAGGLDLYDDGGNAKILIDDGANGLVSILGGTGGVRLDNTVGIGVAPATHTALAVATAVTSPYNTIGFGVTSPVTTTGDAKNINVVNISPSTVVNHASVHPLVSSLYIQEPNITLTAGTVTNATSLYVLNAPTEGVNNYAIFVDAGATRLDGDLEVQGANFRGKVNVADTNYGTSALTDDYIIAFTSLSAARTVTISDEDVASGSITVPRIMIIKDESGSCSGVNTITIALESGNIDGAANVVLDTAYSSITLYLNGTNGFIY